ncbi:hypothetical protein S7711_10516 [Stachybotrys chartarum IBT 7711]|uniref:Uncharacterized protein n=1 Tax=Stachybotrys chartarum (strain CBS 109288 / IBT 7711) TaxID=1280523 RepID=A0A084AJ39_STACB|nr:hypothetical protein S7711_10516 [Stachybotrys chartarum IBT 7711]
MRKPRTQIDLDISDIVLGHGRLRALRPFIRGFSGPDFLLEPFLCEYRNTILGDNCIFYMTDDCHRIAQRRVHLSEACGFETAIHILLLIARGSVAPAGHLSTTVNANSNLASTITTLAGKPLEENDGPPVPLAQDAKDTSPIEEQGLGFPEGLSGIYGYEPSRHVDIPSQIYTSPHNTCENLLIISDSNYQKRNAELSLGLVQNPIVGCYKLESF